MLFKASGIAAVSSYALSLNFSELWSACLVNLTIVRRTLNNSS
ncbi:hypothetical protein [Crocosphaera watsonii]|uniref:Uncharacterized protein n=1 Tax=Crocosphaera watsonii WH 0401 TaxID=555881 RepID=T2J2S5_CROWT|nr:hypothetical protein [Crocosphaera watsonii]CCQ60168.1 hypothetical protein CWATWH0401_1744 [Crocosphaera watsonii WH 0401]